MKLLINSLHVKAKIGKYLWEKVILQTVIVDVEMLVCNVVDYNTVVLYIKELVKIEHREFIEDLAKYVHNQLKHSFFPEKLKLRISKPNCIANADSAAIVIED